MPKALRDYNNDEHLARIGEDEIPPGETERLASAASARRVVQQPETILGIQVACPGGEGL